MIANEVIETVEPITDAPEAESAAESASTTWSRYRNMAGNVCLALLFFIALIPTKSSQYNSTLATDIWFWGAVLMGVLSLVRVPPRSVMINASSILSTAAMMVAPALMRPTLPATGLLKGGSIVVELIGITFTQVARIYLGRRFGLLPANRGVVTGGPFRWMRHPIYSGWVIFAIGFWMANLDLYNTAMFVVSLPFLIWRMALEEEHLTQDPEYRAYLEKTPYRLFPGIY